MPIHLSRSAALAYGIEIPPAEPQKKRKKAGKDPALRQRLFIEGCLAHEIPEPTPEYHFAREQMGREWRFDWAWVPLKLALESDGGCWKSGRHNRASGWLEDMRKLNAAVILGWRVLRCTPQEEESGEVFALLRKALG